MKVKALLVVKTKLFKPLCKKLYRILFKFKIKKPVLIIRSLQPRSRCTTNDRTHHRKSPPLRTRISALLSGFRQLMMRQSKKMDRHRLLLKEEEISEKPGRDHQVLFPSPITPNYAIACGSSNNNKRRDDDDEVEGVEDACRSFENYLVGMIVEEGKVGDLADVEELLYCWKNLKCPLFIDLVCRFYGELCKDLFSP